MFDEYSIVNTTGQKMVLTITQIDTKNQSTLRGNFTLEKLNQLLERVGYIADCEPCLPITIKVGNTGMEYIGNYQNRECRVFYNKREIKASSSELRILCALLKRYESNSLADTTELVKETGLSSSSVKRIIGNLRNTLINATNNKCTVRDNSDKAGYAVIVNN